MRVRPGADAGQTQGRRGQTWGRPAADPRFSYEYTTILVSHVRSILIKVEALRAIICWNIHLTQCSKDLCLFSIGRNRKEWWNGWIIHCNKCYISYWIMPMMTGMRSCLMLQCLTKPPLMKVRAVLPISLIIIIFITCLVLSNNYLHWMASLYNIT